MLGISGYLILCLQSTVLPASAMRSIQVWSLPQVNPFSRSTEWLSKNTVTSNSLPLAPTLCITYYGRGTIWKRVSTRTSTNSYTTSHWGLSSGHFFDSLLITHLIQTELVPGQQCYSIPDLVTKGWVLIQNLWDTKLNNHVGIVYYCYTSSNSLGLVFCNFSNEVSPAFTRVVLKLGPILSSCLEMKREFSHNLWIKHIMNPQAAILSGAVLLTLLVCTCAE